MRNFIKIIIKLMSIVLIIGIIVGILYIYARYVEPNMLRINKEKLKNNTHNFKIVFFSDTHFGDTYKIENIERIVEKINGEKPDLVIFGGDFIDKYAVDKEYIDIDYLSKELEKINATHGKFAVWGNHDRGGGAEWIYGDLMMNGGFTVILNDSVHLEAPNITIKGLDDYLLGNPDMSICDDEKQGYTILVSHAPDAIEDANLSEIDLVLGAHSHGGQVKLPFITKRILPRGAKKYVRGMYDTEGGAKLFVSTGLGTTQLPYRFLNVPEIVVIDVDVDK